MPMLKQQEVYYTDFYWKAPLYLYSDTNIEILLTVKLKTIKQTKQTTNIVLSI
jgi:hypothetical protein